MLGFHPQGQMAIYAVAPTVRFGGMEVLEEALREEARWETLVH